MPQRFVVFAALAVSHWIEHQTAWILRNSCAPHAAAALVQIKAGRRLLTAAH